MINLSLEELKAVAKIRKVKDYKSKSKDELTKFLIESEPKKIQKRSEKKLMNQEIHESKIKEIRRNLYEIENKRG